MYLAYPGDSLTILLTSPEGQFHFIYLVEYLNIYVIGTKFGTESIDHLRMNCDNVGATNDIPNSFSSVLCFVR